MITDSLASLAEESNEFETLECGGFLFELDEMHLVRAALAAVAYRAWQEQQDPAQAQD